jgi:hypothetical protein
VRLAICGKSSRIWPKSWMLGGLPCEVVPDSSTWHRRLTDDSARTRFLAVLHLISTACRLTALNSVRERRLFEGHTFGKIPATELL